MTYQQINESINIYSINNETYTHKNTHAITLKPKKG